MTQQNNSTALDIVRGAFHEGAAVAERQLLIIGKEQGDETLALVARELTPAEVFALAKESDSTKPSIAQAFVTPEQFKEAFSYFGSRYFGNVSSRTLQADLVDFLHPFLTEGTLARRQDMVLGFLEHPLAAQALCCIAAGAPGFLEFFEVERPLVAEPGWQEILLLVHEAAPSKFVRVRRWVQSEFKGGDVADKVDALCSKVVEELAAYARSVVGDSGPVARKDDVFTEI